MRKLAIMAALASTALAPPAVARDNSWYAGVEGGLMLAEDTDLDVDFFDNETATELDDGIGLDYKTGVDIDLIAGYDFGGFRVEAEMGYKNAGIDEVSIAGVILDDD